MGFGRSFAWATVSTLLAGLNATAQEPSGASSFRTFTFDHYLQGDGGTTLVELAPGEEFRIVVAHTCESDFEYAVYKSPHVAKPARAAITGLQAVGSVTKGPIAHESKWGSYVLRVERKPGTSNSCSIWVNADGVPEDPPPTADAKSGGRWIEHVELRSTTYVVAVETNEWEIGADAALVFTAGVDQKYHGVTAAAPAGTVPDPNKKVVAEDVEGESAGRVSFGTLTHFYFPRRQTGPALGFSVLSTQDNQTEYYFGWGYGLGPRASRLNLAAGVAYAPVPTLPAGVAVGDPVADPSALTSLRNVYKWRFFFSLTSTLFRTGESGTKPPAPSR